MKILYHHRTASRDGQAVHIEELIRALRDEGHEVRVVAPDATDRGQMGQDVRWVHRLKAVLPRATYELLELSYSALAYRRLARTVRDFRPDVIYERYNLFLLAGVAAKRRFRIPLLLEVNAPLVYERMRFGGLALPGLASWAERTAWRGASCVLPVTCALAQMVADCGVPLERIEVIPNGINEQHFHDAPSPRDAKVRLGLSDCLVLGFTGFIRDWHGMDRVIRWLASSEAPASAKLLIVGDGPGRCSLESLAKGLGVDGRVIFSGVLPRNKVPDYVAAFDIALQPAVVPYASPLKLFEYLALGKAILAPRARNIEEVLVHGNNAVLFDPSLPRSLEEALSSLAADSALRERLGAAAAATIATRGLTWHNNARRVAAIAERAREQYRKSDALLNVPR